MLLDLRIATIIFQLLSSGSLHHVYGLPSKTIVDIYETFIKWFTFQTCSVTWKTTCNLHRIKNLEFNPVYLENNWSFHLSQNHIYWLEKGKIVILGVRRSLILHWFNICYETREIIRHFGLLSNFLCKNNCLLNFRLSLYFFLK